MPCLSFLRLLVRKGGKCPPPQAEEGSEAPGQGEPRTPSAEGQMKLLVAIVPATPVMSMSRSPRIVERGEGRVLIDRQEGAAVERELGRDVRVRAAIEREGRRDGAIGGGVQVGTGAGSRRWPRR